MEKDPEYLALLQKLWEMTRYPKIQPSLPIIKRLIGMKDVYQEVEIERALRMVLLLSSFLSFPSLPFHCIFETLPFSLLLSFPLLLLIISSGLDGVA